MELLGVLTPAAYFYFNWRYFTWATTAFDKGRMTRWPVVVAFVLNYLIFYLCSILELNLIVNWAVFFAALAAETMLYYGGSKRNALLFSISGSLTGLTINIFCRCVTSIVTSQPLAAFDNHVSSASNLKAVPVLLGFLLGGAFLHLMILPGWLKKTRVLLDHPRHLAFLLEVMCGMFLYLFLNLLIYQSEENGLLLKLWGIKSCIFVTVGTFLAVRYSLQMCRLSDYREENRSIRLELARKAREEDGLRTEAYRDALTGTYNRQYALEQLEDLLEREVDFVLCFADLDHLKEVNDRHGHAEGDRYLLLAARTLEAQCGTENLVCRYGGDEFLLLFRGVCAEAAGERILEADRRLREMTASGAVRFPMSLSWGAIDGGAGQAAEELIRAADRKMYDRKRARAGQAD